MLVVHLITLTGEVCRAIDDAYAIRGYLLTCYYVSTCGSPQPDTNPVWAVGLLHFPQNLLEPGSTRRDFGGDALVPSRDGLSWNTPVFPEVLSM